jgi:hypothetical protein
MPEVPCAQDTTGQPPFGALPLGRKTVPVLGALWPNASVVT